MSREIRRKKEGNLRFTLPRTRFLAHAKTRCRKGKMVEAYPFSQKNLFPDPCSLNEVRVMSREIRREKEGNLRFTLHRTRFLAHAKTRCRKGKMVEAYPFSQKNLFPEPCSLFPE
jgi:quinol monooxygenase YgiN